MSKLFVITFKRPALPIEQALMKIDTAYDCEAVSIPEVAEIRHRDALNKYEDVEMFECEDYEYIEFVKNDDAYAHFVRTGEHSMKPLEEGYKPPFALLVLDGNDNKWKVYKALDSDTFDKEDFLARANKQEFPNGTYTNNYIDAKVVPNTDLDSYLEEDVDVGTESHTETIRLALEMVRTDDTASFDYNVDIDDVGQIVFTPVDTAVSFVDIRRLVDYDGTTDTIVGNTRTFSLLLSANMISEENDFSWFCDIDEIGQAVITPDLEATSFLTVSVNDSLNLVTECNEGLSLEEDSSDIKELCERVIDDLKDLLTSCIQKANKIESYFDQLGIHSADIEPYMIRYLESFISDAAGEVSVAEFKRRLTETESMEECTETIQEEIDELDRNSIIDRFMKGDISIYADDGQPESQLIHLQELDSNNYEYYYDEESDSVVSYVKGE